MNKNLLFILLFFNQILLGEGFIAGTLVKTTNGYVAIEQIKENDTVVSFDLKKQEIVEGKVAKIHKVTLDSFFELHFNNHRMQVAPDHKFFCPFDKNQWLEVNTLQENNFILKDVVKLIRIEKIKKINHKADFYSLTVEHHHNFFISHEDILVHNAPQILVGVVAFAAPAAEAALLTTIIGFLTPPAFVIGGLYAAKQIYNSYKESRRNGGNDSDSSNSNEDGNNSGNNSPNEPPKKPLLTAGQIAAAAAASKNRKKIRDKLHDLMYGTDKSRSTGRTKPATLNEKLAMEKVLSDPGKGKPIVIGKSKGENSGMTDPRWPKKEGWEKVSQTIEVGNEKIDIHYVKNDKMGIYEDFKFKKPGITNECSKCGKT